MNANIPEHIPYIIAELHICMYFLIINSSWGISKPRGTSQGLNADERYENTSPPSVIPSTLNIGPICIRS